MLINNKSLINTINKLNLTDDEREKFNKISEDDRGNFLYNGKLIIGGATTEQAAQIEANRVAIGDSNSGLTKEVNDIKSTELQNLNTAIQTLETLVGVDETVGDKSELPSGDANIIASINRIDSKPSGTVTNEQISTAVNNYLTEHPVQSGATTEQAAQIEANRTAIGDSSSGLIKEVNDIKNTELQNLNTAILGVNETLGDKTGLPSGDANVIASINRIDSKPSGTVTNEQISTAVNNYLTEHPVQSGATAEQAAQIQANTTAIGDSNSGLIKKVNDINKTIENLQLGSGNVTFEDYISGQVLISDDSAIKTYGGLVVSTTTISVNESASSSFTIKLDNAPTQNQTVNINPNNSNISVSPNSIVFTPENYSFEKNIAVTGVHDEASYDDKSATINIASTGTASKSITVTIKNIDITVAKPVTGITLNKTSLELTQNDKFQMEATVIPDDADNKTITWSTTEPTIATITASGLVTCVGAGECAIVATANDGSGVSSRCSLLVNAVVYPTAYDNIAVVDDSLICVIDSRDGNNNDQTITLTDRSLHNNNLNLHGMTYDIEKGSCWNNDGKLLMNHTVLPSYPKGEGKGSIKLPDGIREGTFNIYMSVEGVSNLKDESTNVVRPVVGIGREYNTYDFNICVGSDQSLFLGAANNNTMDSPLSLNNNLNTFNYITITFNTNNTVSAYINGELKNENVLSNSFPSYHWISLQSFGVSKNNLGVNDESIVKWQYIVDRFNFYNIVLTPEEIRANYNKIIGVQQ